MRKFYLNSFLYTVCVLIGCIVVLCVPQVSYANYPLLANYFLNELPREDADIEELASYDVLILSASQIKAHPTTISQIKRLHTDIQILAYIPSQSYNEQFWKNDILFRSFAVQDDWWMKDSSGRIISHWPGLLHTNLSDGWNTYLTTFINTNIMSLPHVDGVFLDMISNNISWLQNGDVDRNRDGKKDNPNMLDTVWRQQTTKLLRQVRDTIGDESLLLINGSSEISYQSYINGRMFETFPTPWEQDGRWQTIMNTANTIHAQNHTPLLHIFNRNTNNTGYKTNYQSMRFGLASSLLIDGVYYSFDYGDQNHGQLWWYDEYDVSLGDALSGPISPTGATNFAPGVWRRDFDRGISLVNSAGTVERVELGGEYEAIRGVQDATANNGAIVSNLTLSAQDGRILLKTTETLDDVIYTNGDFARFFTADGTRVRNGYFVFDDTERGGTQIARIDMDGNGIPEIITVQGPRVQIYRDNGELYMKAYPYTANYKGDIRIAIGDLDNNGFSELFVAPGSGNTLPIKVYARHGTQIKRDWYPFGEGYSGGYSLAVGALSGPFRNNLVIGAGTGSKPYVNIYDWKYNKTGDWFAYETTFTGGVFVATGDIDGDGVDEVVTGPGVGKEPLIRTFEADGSLSTEFMAYSSFLKDGIIVRTADVDFDGIDDIVGLSNGVGF